MILPQRTDPVWADIIAGDKEFQFEFLAIRIFLGYARFKFKNAPSDLPQLANELYNIFETNKNISSVQRDICKFNNRKDDSNAKLFSVRELERPIKSGKRLLLVGDEELLKQLPPGNWIGGTIPYFMAPEGGLISKERIFVTELPDYIQSIEIQSYDENDIRKIYVDSPPNGFSFLILPATSPVHLSFALHAPQYQNFGVRSVVGWVSGVHLSDLGKISPKTINGQTLEISDKKAIVMRCVLPDDMSCEMNIVNIFSQGDGDIFEVIENGFSVQGILVNGKLTNFVAYLLKHNLDLKLPLVANYCGANINVSFQGIDGKKGRVNFYAPLFKGVQYKQAKPVSNYVKDFILNMPEGGANVLFSCNCILNFLYSGLEGKTTGGITGPITFGEVAYQLLNQTMVYLTVEKKDVLSTGKQATLEQQLRKAREELAVSDSELNKMLPKMEAAFQEVKQIQQQFLDIINFSPDAMFVIDVEGRVIAWNKAIEGLTGIMKEDILGKANHEYALPFCGERRSVLADLVMRNDPDLEKTYPLLKKDGNALMAEHYFTDSKGEKRYVWGKAVPLFDLQGKITGAIETIRDITDRKRAEEELKRTYEELKNMQAQLVQSEKMASIGQLAAGVAHEINNPIGFISNNMELLGQYIGEYSKVLRMAENLQKSIDEGDMEKAKSISKEMSQFEEEIGMDYTINDIDNLLQHNQRGLERVCKIVMDLRIFAHEGSDFTDMVNIEDVIDSVINIVHNELRFKAELKKDYGTTPQVKCSPQRIGQVFINLLINAAQAIKDKGIIEIKTYSKDGRVYVEVRDTGHGIKEEHLKKVFDPFFTTKPVGKGTGLGLSVSHEIIKKHGGEIKVQSKVGEGTVFAVMLPAVA